MQTCDTLLRDLRHFAYDFPSGAEGGAGTSQGHGTILESWKARNEL